MRAIEAETTKPFRAFEPLLFLFCFRESQPSLSLLFSTFILACPVCQPVFHSNQTKIPARERKTQIFFFFESNKILRLFYVFLPLLGLPLFVYEMLFSSLFHRLTFSVCFNACLSTTIGWRERKTCHYFPCAAAAEVGEGFFINLRVPFKWWKLKYNKRGRKSKKKRLNATIYRNTQHTATSKIDSIIIKYFFMFSILL